MANEIEVTDIGPIKHIVIPVPKDGGLVCFRGANGSGKTTLLNTIEAAVTGKGTVPVRDGALKGEFVGLGVRLSIGRSTRRSGEAEVHALDGRLSVADLVDPGIADPEKADAHRIKALVQLAGCKADPALFHALFADAVEFDGTISAAAAVYTHQDLVAMAAAIKRDLEATARRVEAAATEAAAKAAALAAAAYGVDVTAPHDAAALQAALERAIAARSDLAARAREADKALEAADKGRKHLERTEAEYNGPTSAEAEAARDAAQNDLQTAQSAVLAAERVLTQARERFAAAKMERDLREMEREAAERHERTMAQWRQQVEAAAAVSPVAAEDLKHAEAAVARAKEELERGVAVRRALAQVGEAEEAGKEAARHRQRAERLRQAARGTDEVLNQVVSRSGVPLRVEPVAQRMRLTLETSRGRTCFAELSDGERWRVALDIAIKTVGRGGELTLPQHAFEALDPANRRAIAEQARAGGVIIYTAEAADGDLRAVVYGEGNGHA